MTELLAHPALVLIGGGFALFWLRGTVRAVATLALPLAALALVWQVGDGAVVQLAYAGDVLTPLQGDRLSRLFATIFALVAAAGGLYALGQPSRLEVPAAFFYAGAAIGVVFAGDWLTVFAFWELMAIGSTLVLWSRGNAASYRAARRYLMIHLLGGVLLLAGIAGHVGAGGTLALGRLSLDHPAHALMLAAMLVNAGAPPVSAWLPDAYPEASYSGTVFLSAFTTKTAVYALMRTFPGTELLVWIGLFMVFYGIVYAALENDLRRILAYAIVNQVGFMVAGVGIGTELALNGVAAQAFVHILYKALLLMVAGSVLAATGRRKCTELGGLFRSMPLTTACAMIGALTTLAFPLTAGFVAKSMASQAAADAHLQTVWLLFTAAAAGGVLHAGLRFPWFVFFHRDAGLRPPDPPAPMRWAMGLLAAACIGLGAWPQPLRALLPYPNDPATYTAAHVLTQLQLLLFAAAAFFWLLRYVAPKQTVTLDTDWLWRRAAPALVAWATTLLRGARHRLRAATRWVADALLAGALRLIGPHSRFSRTWPTGAMAVSVLAMLLAYLLLYYI